MARRARLLFLTEQYRTNFGQDSENSWHNQVQYAWHIIHAGDGVSTVAEYMIIK